MSHGFRQVGDDGSAKEVWKYGERGVDLAKYLVTDHSWRGIYINPDVAHPRDGDSEHSYTSFLARKKCQYYGIPLKYRVENNLVTSASDDAFQKLNKNTHQSVLNTIDIKSLEKVDFGFGLSRGGMHTWLFSKGSVYEVHWDKIGAELYEVSPLRRYPWLSGAIVIPPLQSSLLSANSKLACSAQ